MSRPDGPAPEWFLQALRDAGMYPDAERWDGTEGSLAYSAWLAGYRAGSRGDKRGVKENDNEQARP